MDPVDIEVQQIIGQGVLRAFGLPGHLRVCQGCGVLAGECVCDEGDEDEAA